MFINACVREESRTFELAKKELENFNGDITELVLQAEDLRPLNGGLLARRDTLLENGKTDSPMFAHARQFAEADRVVIAAPFWDLGFPSLLKIYLETIMVAGITFEYEEGIPKGLCNAKSLRYITTSGGRIHLDFGYSYIKCLAKSFFGIGDVSGIKAENLDVYSISPCELFDKAEITEFE